MALTTRSKIKEMIKHGKADPNVLIEYNEAEEKYKVSKERYRNNREELKEAEEQLEEAKNRLKETPFGKRGHIKRRVKLLKKKVQNKRKKYETSKENLKKRIKQLREFRKIVREQSKVFRKYENFFAKILEAQRLGIDIPRYIKEEAKGLRQEYRRAQFGLSRKGISQIPEPNITTARDLSSLIMEKRAKDVQEGVQKVVVRVKEVFEKTEGPGDR